MSVNPLFISSSENKLEILVQPDTIVYSVIDENDNVMLRQEINMLPGKSADIAFYEHFFNQPELKIQSENVSVVFENNSYQLIPSELFREKDMSLFFETEHGKSEYERLHYLVLPKWGVHFVCRIPDKMTSFFQSKYPEVVIEHHVSNLMKNRIAKNENEVTALVRKGMVDILVVKANQLVLVNSFETTTPEDILYSLLKVYEQLELDEKTYPLCVMFKSAEDEKLMLLLKSYFQNIKTKNECG